MTEWFLAFFIAAFFALVATRAVMALQISDAPDEARKLHTKVTATSGGIGIIVGIFAATAFSLWQGAVAPSAGLFACLTASLIGGILGLLDDLYKLGPKRKLAIMLAAILGFVMFGGHIDTLQLTPDFNLYLGPVLGTLGTILWLVVIVNTVNFMDGANGMAMGCAGIGLLGLCALMAGPPGTSIRALDTGVLGWIGCGACLGFLYWNALKGRIFAGDCGALFVGLLCGTLGVLAVVGGVNPLSVATCFLPMLVDVILTIILRIKRRENILTAHSWHAYQIAIRHGASHMATSARYWLQTLICVASAFIAAHKGGLAPLGIFLTFVLIFCGLYAKLFWDIRTKARAEVVD